MFSNREFKVSNLDVNIVDEVDELIKKAVEIGASDIHIEPMENNIRIRYRLDGKLLKVKEFPIDYLSKIVTRIKILGELDVAEKRLSQDGGFKFDVEDREVDIRISTILTIYGEKIVLRILLKDDGKVNLNNLGIGKEDIEEIRKIIEVENGLIYLTGPTGCGKTTTLYSIIKELNEEDVNIITIEDPVEFKIDGVNQVQVNEGANIKFSNALRSILRQDPEIILVGETRDRETASISIRASITGHKVFSTLHTNDSYSAIIRLLDMGVEDYLIKASLKGVVSQRLIRVLCNNCKEEVEVKNYQREIFKNTIDVEIPSRIYKPVGCEKCNKGYLGRKAVMEILYIDNDFRDLIKSNIDLDELRDMGKKKNIKNLLQKTTLEVFKGVTSFEELMSFSIYMDDNHEEF